jgi:C-terminal processing protease CtpA/Prc
MSLLAQFNSTITLAQIIRIFHFEVKKTLYDFYIETLASDAGLKKGDFVVKINDSQTNKLSNDELRKIMRHRIKCNSINLVILGKQLEEQCNYKFYFNYLTDK